MKKFSLQTDKKQGDRGREKMRDKILGQEHISIISVSFTRKISGPSENTTKNLKSIFYFFGSLVTFLLANSLLFPSKKQKKN